MPIINLKGVTSKSFDPFAGTFVVVIDEVEDKVSSNGNPQHELGLSVTDIVEVTEGDEENIIGRKIRDYITLTADSLWKLKQFMLAIGYGDEDLEGEIEYDSSEWIGHEITVRVGIEKGRGSYPDRPRVRVYLSEGMEEDESQNAMALNFDAALAALSAD